MGAGPWVVVRKGKRGKFRARRVEGGRGVEVEWRAAGAAGWEGCRWTKGAVVDGHRRPEWRHETSTTGGVKKKCHAVRADVVDLALDHAGAAAGLHAHHTPDGKVVAMAARPHSAMHGRESGAARRRKRDAAAAARAAKKPKTTP